MKSQILLPVFCLFMFVSSCGGGPYRPNVRWLHQYPYQRNGTEFISHLVERTVRIETVAFTNGGQRTTGLGSGAIISSDGLILTANHVLGAQFLNVRVSRCALVPQFGMINCGSQTEARVLRRDIRHDLALIRASGARNWPSFRLGKARDMKNGEMLWRIGMDVTGWTSGVLLDPHQGSRSLEILMPARGGASGGPVANGRGELVGIVTSTPAAYVAVDIVTYAVPVEVARERLLRNPFRRRRR